MQVTVRELILSERGDASTLWLQLAWRWDKAAPKHAEVVVCTPQLKSVVGAKPKEGYRHKEPELTHCMVPVSTLGNALTFFLEARDASGQAVARSKECDIPDEIKVLESALDEQNDKPKAKQKQKPTTRKGKKKAREEEETKAIKAAAAAEDHDSEEAYYRPPPPAPEDMEEEAHEYADVLAGEDLDAYELGISH